MQTLHAQKSFQGYIFQGVRTLSFEIQEMRALKPLVTAGVNHIIGKIDDELRKAAFRSGVVAED